MSCCICLFFSCAHLNQHYLGLYLRNTKSNLTRSHDDFVMYIHLENFKIKFFNSTNGCVAACIMNIIHNICINFELLQK